MRIRFSDAAGTALDVLAVNGRSVFFQGAQRGSLEIQIARDKITFGALDALTGNAANTAHLTLIDGDKQYVHDHYSLRVSLALKPVAAAAAGSAPARAEERLCLTLARKTYAELQAERLQSSVDALTLSALGVTECSTR